MLQFAVLYLCQERIRTITSLQVAHIANIVLCIVTPSIKINRIFKCCLVRTKDDAPLWTPWDCLCWTTLAVLIFWLATAPPKAIEFAADASSVTASVLLEDSPIITPQVWLYWTLLVVFCSRWPRPDNTHLTCNKDRTSFQNNFFYLLHQEYGHRKIPIGGSVFEALVWSFNIEKSKPTTKSN